jgi:hypothetical protein
MKLIREFDDFNWVREIDPEVYFKDVRTNRFYGVKILNGFLEALEDCGVDDERIPEYLRTEKVFVNSSGYYPHNDIWCDSDIDDKVLTLHLDFIDSNGVFLQSWWVTDEMVKLYLLEPDELNESNKFDDFNWVREIPVNPWLRYDWVVFDIQPDPEVVNQLIELALYDRGVGNGFEWKVGRKEDISNIIDYQENYGSSYLVIDEKDNMTYGDFESVNPPDDAKMVYYSDLFVNNLNESKDEWDWARDIKPELPFEYVEPKQYYNVTVLDKLVQAMDSCYGESQTHLKYLDATRVKVWKKEYLTYDDLWCSGYEEDDDGQILGLEVDFIDADGELMGGFWVSNEMVKLFPLNLNESKDEWEWIRDIEPTITDINNPPMVGDVLICLPGFNNTDEDDDGGGGGYVEGRIIVVGSVDIWEFDHPGKQIIVWPDRDMSAEYWDGDTGCFDCGIYGRALTYYK